jgi:IS4 transposase
MLSCNGITLEYSTVLYDKSKTKIDVVKEIAAELPVAPVASYLLCDCWYTSKKLIDAFLSKGFYTIGAVKANRVIYPCGIKQNINEFAKLMEKTDSNIRLVTVGSRQYYVYRYEGSLNGIEDAVVLITYPKDAFGNPRALRAFLCTDTSLTTVEILDIYAERWQIEVFFRQAKNVLAFDKYQIRSSKGIKRFWLIMSLVHFLCCTAVDKENHTAFSEGYNFFQKELHRERIAFIYQCGSAGIPLDDVFQFVA